jgi:hypothetical protein
MLTSKKEDMLTSKKEDMLTSKKEDMLTSKKEDMLSSKKEDMLSSKKQNRGKPKKQNMVKTKKEDMVKTRKQNMVKTRKQNMLTSEKEDMLSTSKPTEPETLEEKEVGRKALEILQGKRELPFELQIANEIEKGSLNERFMNDHEFKLRYVEHIKRKKAESEKRYNSPQREKPSIWLPGW